MLSPHRARKRFGQNFLQDQAVIDDIALAVRAKPGDRVVEIGPGEGALTAALLARNAALTAIEIDRDLLPRLQQRFADWPEFQLLNVDALQFDFTRLPGPLRVVGNLPYNISTPILFYLLDFRAHIRDMHFMLQKEVVERLAAPPGGKSYGRLSVMCQYFCKVEPLFEVPPTAFRPVPKVDSAVVRMTPHLQLPHVAVDFAMFDRLVKQAFGQRRKTLRKALTGIATPAQLTAAVGSDELRAENLSVAMFVKLANHLSPS